MPEECPEERAKRVVEVPIFRVTRRHPDDPGKQQDCLVTAPTAQGAGELTCEVNGMHPSEIVAIGLMKEKIHVDLEYVASLCNGNGG